MCRAIIRDNGAPLKIVDCPFRQALGCDDQLGSKIRLLEQHRFGQRRPLLVWQHSFVANQHDLGPASRPSRSASAAAVSSAIVRSSVACDLRDVDGTIFELLGHSCRWTEIHHVDGTRQNDLGKPISGAVASIFGAPNGSSAKVADASAAAESEVSSP